MLRFLRKTHLYVGLFISPALLFFAFTGAMQTLNLHEPTGAYKPPAWLDRLGHLHKKQTLEVQVRKPSENSPRDAKPHPQSVSEAASAPKGQSPVTLLSTARQHLPMKLFFLLVSLGLFTSTVTGIYMAYKYQRGKVLVTGLLLLGLVVPLFLLSF